MGARCTDPNNTDKIIYHQSNIGASWIIFSLEILIVLGVVILLINRFFELKKNNVGYYIGIFIGWFLAIYSIVLMLIDINMAWYDKCICDNLNITTGIYNSTEDICKHLLPYNYIDSDILAILWQVLYWISFFFTWLIFPIAQSYSDSSEFSFWSRLKASIIAKGIFYGAVGILCVIFFLVIFFTTANKNFLTALGVAMALANSWGLLLVVCFLGVGVIINPRNMWRKSQYNVLYKKRLWKVGELYGKYKKSRDKLFTTLRCVKKYDDEIRLTDPNREYMDIIIKNCPQEYQTIFYGSVDEVVKNERKHLVDLNYRVIQDSYRYHCNYTKFHKAIEKTLDMEDIYKPSKTRFKMMWTYPKNSFVRRVPVIRSIFNFLEWAYWMFVAKWFWRFVSILCYCATIVVLWNEVTMFSSFLNKDSYPTLSLYYLLIWKVKGITPFALQVIAFFAISYNAWCTYKTLLTLRFFNWYRIEKHKLTNLYSIIFASAYICRISVPIVLNMIYLVGFDKTHSSFIRVMGPMSVVPFLGGNFHVIFPTVIIIISILTIFNCWDRILSCFKKRKFKFNEYFTDDLIDRGKEIIAKEKAAIRSKSDINYFGDNFNRIKERFPMEETIQSINENESTNLLVDFESGYNRLSDV